MVWTCASSPSAFVTHLEHTMNLFLEAEQFAELGGWVIDTQCVPAMGSPYLMAHGIGKPVADAVTTVSLAPGQTWHAWVRTRDWTAVWKRGHAAGQFQLLVDGTPLPAILGTNGPHWAWQHAGSFTTTSSSQTLALHDLTGFNGRADAIYLSTDPADIPPDNAAQLAQFRRTHTDATLHDDPTDYDLIVIGGGYAGISAALAARTLGLRVLLVQDRPLLGGCGSSEVRVWTGGRTHIGDYPRLGTIAAAISPIDGRPGQRKTLEMFEDHRKLQLFRPGHDLLLNELMLDAELDPDNPRRITAVITRNVRTGQLTRHRARLFADCSGDATLARLAHCQTMYGREGTDDFGESLAPRTPDREVMGLSVLWEPKDMGHPVDFPDIDWGIEFNDDNGLKRFNCCWDWECGQHRDQVTDCEHIRDYGLMTVLANWAWLKNRSPYRDQAANLELEWLSPIGGKRESYRVVGDHIITQRDIEDKVPYDDATAALTWSIDLHLPDPQNTATFQEGFLSCAYHRGTTAPYGIPYRCLYARDADNLLLGGRIISATHVAFSCIRVMRTLGMLGEVVGMAAAVCRHHDCTPRDVYASHLEELKTLMRDGIVLPQPCGYMPGPPLSSYHFMRPVGSIGNSDENIWVHCDKDENFTSDVPPSIAEAIRQLDVIH